MLKRRSFPELTIEHLMARAGLSRPAFYVYFKDRYDLVIQLVEKISTEMFTMIGLWNSGSDDPVEDLHLAFDGVARVCVKYGHIFRAFADAAAQHPKVEKVYRRLMDQAISTTAERIKADIKRGKIKPLDADEVARALCLMGERFYIEALGRHPKTEPESVVRTMLTIWGRTLYGSAEPAAPAAR
jgi:AcrR family transcriptional regulator